MSITEEARKVRDILKEQNELTQNKIDTTLTTVKPFNGGGEIKLIIIGQDPTIKNKESRKKIACTLNLDKGNSLKSYITEICSRLGITIDNVYATNLFKYFYSEPPAKTMNVLFAHLQPNLDLLNEELSVFKNVPIITLGEPVLQLLTTDKAKVRVFWDYNSKTGESNGIFTYSKANENKLNRDFYPFPHQPSLRKMFYKQILNSYIEYVKSNNKLYEL